MNVQNTISASASLSTVSLSSFSRNLKVCASDTLNQMLQENTHRQNT